MNADKIGKARVCKNGLQEGESCLNAVAFVQ